jgi:3-deoxy-D-manno-octulosonic-acid transferase
MSVLYQIAIHIYYLLVLAASPFNGKARLWIRGRYGWRKKLRGWNPGGPVIWFHAASLGEFEQGRPVMEKMRAEHPGLKILLTFYSPSGYEVRKNYAGADKIVYLPLDTWYNARTFIRLVKPVMAIFIKYEFWPSHLETLHRSDCKIYLISGIFRSSQPFFKKYGSWYRKKLSLFEYFFLQDEPSAGLLKGIGYKNSMVAGDTRFDRVSDVAAAAKDIEIARQFSEGHTCVVAGSTWPGDEQYLVPFINASDENTRFILAPHEITESHISQLLEGIRVPLAKYSDVKAGSLLRETRVLIIDNIGMLSSIYRYGHVAYIGGGFGKGIHNVLEAATFHIPVIFGPNFQKFREARELLQSGGAFTVGSYEALEACMNTLLQRGSPWQKAAEIAGNYVKDNTGATSVIINHVSPNLPL